MTLSEIKSGMVVKTHHGMGLVVGTDQGRIIYFENTFTRLDRYFKEDLTSSMNRSTDIVAVYAPKVTNSFSNLLKEDPGSLIWPKPAVEKTVEEIEKELNMVPGTLRIKK